MFQKAGADGEVTVNTRRGSILILTASLLVSIGISTPARAEGNAATYLNDPLFIELVTDMGYTAALISDDTHTINFAGEATNYNNGVPVTKYAEEFSMSSNVTSAQMAIHNWNTTSNSWGPAEATERYGYSDGTTFGSIDATKDELGRAALKRLKKTGATWAIKKNSFDGLQVGMYAPFVLRPSLVGSTVLTSVGMITQQGKGTITNILVERNTPAAGSDTFRLTSAISNMSSDFSFVVTSDHIVTTARQDEYITDSNGSAQSTSQELRILDLASTVEVPMLMAAGDKTVDYASYLSMKSRITSERAITPTATSIKSKATVLARAAKGKNKNVVTAKVIQNAAKALHITAKSTKTGIKLTGSIEFPDVRGYMCVSAVKKKTVVAHC